MGIPERTCCACFKRKPKPELVAVTRLKDGTVLLNVDQKLSGRSAYICRLEKCLNNARNRKGKNGLEFVLKVKIPDKIWADIEKIIKKT
jgi:predicted RNA-binding protein YlxR (DUF448 family)